MGFEFYEERDFKDTELGPLPVDWKVVRLGEVAEEIFAGGDAPKDRFSKFPTDIFKIPIYTNGREEAALYGFTDYPKVNVPAITISARGTIGYCDVRENPFYPAIRLIVIIPKPSFDIWFIKYAIDYTDFSCHFDKSPIPQLTVPMAKNLLIPMPPLSEQKTIAEVLSIISKAKEKTERVIKATKELKKSMMKHLFTYGYVPVDETDKVKLKETEIGLIPEHWEVVRLGEVAEKVSNGLTKKQNKNKVGYMVTRIETISQGTISCQRVGYVEDVTPVELEKFRLRTGDILFSHINSEPQLGNCAIYLGIPELILHGMNLLMIRVKEHVATPFFIFYLIRHLKAKGIFISISSRAVNQASINQQKLKSLPIPLPPLEEQKAIAEALRAIDEKLQKEEEYKKALQNLFKSLLHHLMSGKIRVRRKTN